MTARLLSSSVPLAAFGVLAFGLPAGAHAQDPSGVPTTAAPPTAGPEDPAAPGAGTPSAPSPEPAPPVQGPSPVQGPAPTVVLVAPAPPAQGPTPPAPAEEEQQSTWWGDHPVALEDEAWVPGEGLEFHSKDNLFALALRLRAQFLYQVDRPYDEEEGERGDLEQNLTIRRARIVFGGHLWGEKTQYKVELAISPADLGMSQLPGTDNPPMTDRDNYVSRSLLLDWYLQFNQIRDLNFRIGQYKVPFSRDRVVSSGDLQFVDRTLLNQEFNVDRDIGFDFRSKDLFGLGNRLRYYVGVYNGDGHSQYELGDFGLMYLGRLEFLPLGKFDDYSQGDLVRSDKPGLSLGVAYARIQKAAGRQGILGRRPADGGTTDYDNVTGDITFKYAGFSLENAYFWRDGKRHAGDAVDDDGMPVPVTAPRAGWGAGIQAGYLLPTIDLEGAARYSAIRKSGDEAETSLGDQNEVAVALSYYIARHSYKVQADWSRFWGEGVSDAGVDIGQGLDRFRVQMQAAF